jgi:hypothetical protein
MGPSIYWKRDNARNILWQGNVGDFRFGTQANTDGSGLPVSASRTANVRIHGDTGGLTTTGSVRNVVSRLLIGTAQTAHGTITSLQGQVKAVASCTGDYIAGVWGYFESSGTLTLTPGNAICGVRATVDCPSGTTIASGKLVAGLLIDSIDLGGTHTGKAVGIYARDAATGSFDAFLALDASSEFLADSGAGGGTSKYLKVLVGGVAYSILVKSDA